MDFVRSLGAFTAGSLALGACLIPGVAGADVSEPARSQVECRTFAGSESLCRTLSTQVWNLHQIDTEKFVNFDLSIESTLITGHTPILWPNGDWGYGIPSLLQLAERLFQFRPVAILAADITHLRIQPIDTRTVLLWGPITLSYRYTDGPDDSPRDMELVETFVYRKDSSAAYGWIRLQQQAAVSSPLPAQ